MRFIITAQAGTGGTTAQADAPIDEKLLAGYIVAPCRRSGYRGTARARPRGRREP
jgi:hypothetical protein